jgi:hypothetical protein
MNKTCPIRNLVSEVASLGMEGLAEYQVGAKAGSFLLTETLDP